MLYLLHDKLRDWEDSVGVYGVFGLLDQIEFRALGAAILAFLLVMVFGRPVITRLLRMKIGDSGLADTELLRSHSASKANTPTMGGVLIAGAILVATLLLGDLRVGYIHQALVVLIVFASIGGIDDWLKLTAARRGAGSRQGLYAWEKLVAQLGLALVVALFAYRQGDTGDGESMAFVLTLPLQRTYVPGTGEAAPGLIYLSRAAFIFLTVMMIAGMSNAVNITDGMDGLAGGIGAAVTFGLAILALIAGSRVAASYLLVPHVTGAGELAVVAGAMFGACVGFLWWNCAPAQVFMGDTGSLALGGLIGYIAVVVRQELVVLIMCGVFIAEIASVVLQVGWFKYTRRTTGTGRRIFRVAPYHHHLHMGGWTEQQVVVRFWLISILLVVVALASLKVR